MLKADDHVDGPDRSPALSLAGIGPGIGVHVALKQQPAGVRLNTKHVVKKTLDMSLRFETIGQPAGQEALGVDGLVEGQARVPP